MTTFKTVVRRKRADGFYPVYIRVVHRTKMGYISTGKIVTDKQILKSGDIKDPVVNELLLSDKSFLIDTPFFWRGQKVKG